MDCAECKDAAYCYRRSVVCASVHELCQNRRTNRDASQGVDSGGPRNHALRFRTPRVRTICGHFLAHREVKKMSGVSQTCSLIGSRGAACRSQYCSKVWINVWVAGNAVRFTCHIRAP